MILGYKGSNADNFRIRLSNQISEENRRAKFRSALKTTIPNAVCKILL